MSSSGSGKRAYRGAILHSLGPDRLAYFEDGILLVGVDGRIEACQSWESYAGSLEAVEVTVLESEQLLVPGLIDTHVHLPQLSVAGMQDNNLLHWLEEYIFEAESRFEDASVARRRSRWFFEELLRNGTTTAAVFLTSHPEAANIAFEEAVRTGNRVVMGQNLMDCNAPESLIRPTAQLLEETEELCGLWHGKEDGRIRYAWMPRFAPTSTEALLEGIGRLRERYPDVYFHTHLSEQKSEIGVVLGQFPWARDYTAVYGRYGLLRERTILAHAIHLSDDELDRLKAAQCSLAHCPGSNFFLKSGRFRLFDALERRMRIGLGSDVGAGPELSMLKAMKDAQFMQREQVSLETLLYLATLGGARALWMDDRLGNFEPGKEADFLILDLTAKSTLEPPFPSDGSDAGFLLSRLVYLGDDRLVRAAFVQGRKVYETGSFPGFCLAG